MLLLAAQVRCKVLDQIADAEDDGAVFSAILALASIADCVNIDLRARQVRLADVFKEELLAAVVVCALVRLVGCRDVPKVDPKNVVVVVVTTETWHLLDTGLVEASHGVIQVQELVTVAELGLALGLFDDEMDVGSLHGLHQEVLESLCEALTILPVPPVRVSTEVVVDFSRLDHRVSRQLEDQVKFLW